MIRTTPHSVQQPTGPTPFSVKPNVSVEYALSTASDYLACAAATAYEVADNSTQEFRALARSVVHQLEAARALVEASIAGLSHPASLGQND